MTFLRLRARAVFTALSVLAAVPAGGDAQEVGPPVVEYRGRGIGTFEVRNNSLFPMHVVIEPFGFVQDSLGKITYVPFDTARVRLRLSAMSLRLPARSALSVSYEVSSDSVPAWLVITSTFHGTRRQGVNYNFQLPHVVYLHQKTPVRKDEIQLAGFAFDGTARQARFKIRNASGGLTRCGEGTLSSAAGARAPIAAFPLFPRFERWVTVDWAHADAPTRVRLSCTGGELTLERSTAAGGAP
jgi:hypothetical protein